MRVSTKDQDTENQGIRLRDYVKMRGWDLIGEYQDKISGLKDNRPDLNRLMEEARKGKFDVVVAVKLDRLGRSVPHLLDISEEFRNLGIHMTFTDQPIDTSSSMGRMVFVILGAVAQFERDLTSERTRANIEKRKRTGGQVGKRSYKDPGSKSYIPPDKRMRILELRERGMSFRNISKDSGIPLATVHKIIKEGVHKYPPLKSGGDTVGDLTVHNMFVLGTPEEVE